jgi:ubiquinone/menaquinone biosynthesis C-methylase UbiE
MKEDLKFFAKDVEQNGTYVYATGSTLSIKLSSDRRCKSILGIDSFAGKTVLDIGCGDGIYTQDIAKQNTALVVGIDPIEDVIKHAQNKYKDVPNLKFECADLYKMEIPKEPYDLVILRGVLHHLPDLEKGIKRACLLGKRVIILEPNGYNLILKIIEKTSKYHIDHQEQSFVPSLLRSEFIKNGGKILREEYINLVPTFCPDWLTKIVKHFEPIVEKIPYFRNIACGQYVFLVEMKNEA